MRKADVVGKRIVGILQCRERERNADGTQIWHIQEMYLEDGTTLVFRVTDLEDGHAISFTAWRNDDELVHPPRKPRVKRARIAEDQEGARSP